MQPQKRREKILALLRENSDITIERLAKLLKTSTPTIYRDFDILEKQNNITKLYGGVQLIKDSKLEHDFYKRLKANADFKKAIALEAVKLISEDETIALDESTTAYFLAEELKKSCFKNITIITNSVLIPPEFVNNNHVRVISTGGIVHNKIAGFVGNIAENSLNNFHCSKYFFSSAGISESEGVLDAYIPESIRLKEMILSITDEAICMVDSSKFLKRGTVNWIGFDKLKKIITDQKLDKKIINNLRQKNITVIVSAID